jgi:hypothetical protein
MDDSVKATPRRDAIRRALLALGCWALAACGPGLHAAGAGQPAEHGAAVRQPLAT